MKNCSGFVNLKPSEQTPSSQAVLFMKVREINSSTGWRISSYASNVLYCCLKAKFLSTFQTLICGHKLQVQTKGMRVQIQMSELSSLCRISRNSLKDFKERTLSITVDLSVQVQLSGLRNVIGSEEQRTEKNILATMLTWLPVYLHKCSRWMLDKQ